MIVLSFNLYKIPRAIDVWEIVSKHLPTTPSNITKVYLYFNVNYEGKAKIRLAVPEENEMVRKKFELSNETSEILIKELCTKFNIPYDNLNSLFFNLSPDEMPTFNVGLYPFVNDVTELNSKKSRMDPITID